MKAIEFKNVHFSYDDGEDGEVFSPDAFSLCGIDFSVNEGEFVAVLGHNGSGKSTLARLSNALLLPSSGEVTVFGLDTSKEENEFAIREQVGIVFQNPDNQTVASIVARLFCEVGVFRFTSIQPVHLALPSGMVAYRVFGNSGSNVCGYFHILSANFLGCLFCTLVS